MLVWRFLITWQAEMLSTEGLGGGSSNGGRM